MQSHNNSGLFRTKKYTTSRQKKKKYGRLFIRRSKIYPSVINNSSSSHCNNFTVNYRPKTARIRHGRLRRKLLNGAGDEKPPVSSSNEQKYMDFSELEHIFDSAIRNKLPVELYKEKPQTTNVILTPEENLHQQSLSNIEPAIDTRIELSNQEPAGQKINRGFIHQIKQHKILSAITLVALSTVTGFLSVLIFIK
ncbi:unnamed protein product [Rotaria magnacalcarata]|uniref:Uncharacterized protein n=2 Tax=Rotaria magnacalcarata TaxID=392030 RepID=A0A815QY64_9BILA|nr:unnamed protein product [Rotaria magnacalcarata]CAF3861819.1 unnamed protein product [Rotaria magnacalcarata]CAF3877928.1 unnamed protein product [Rotaria magnacalcarata]CAF3924756.1 unnamed protein product [Rotaria magnacalcarata]CAF3986231.1 unnamed protein product [Rotaria magnacalcarata]